jgi:hypothetical protein
MTSLRLNSMSAIFLLPPLHTSIPYIMLPLPSRVSTGSVVVRNKWLSVERASRKYGGTKYKPFRLSYYLQVRRKSHFRKTFRHKSPLPASGFDVGSNSRHLGHRSCNSRHLAHATRLHGALGAPEALGLQLGGVRGSGGTVAQPPIITVAHD